MPGGVGGAVSRGTPLSRSIRILRAERHGKQVFYAPADEHIRCTIADMVAHVGEPSGVEEA